MYGKRISKALERRGIEIADVIKKTGISPSTFYKRLRETDLPTDFIDTVCEATGVPRSEIYFTAEEFAAISGADPSLSPIVDELNRIKSEKSKTEQMIAFRLILAALKAM